MAQTPRPIARLDRYLATVTLAHEAVWELRRATIVLGLDDPRVHDRFRDAADLVVIEMPRILGEARRLRATWSEQELLDPGAATETLRLLAEELDRVDPAMRTLRARQNEIARELRRILDESA